jgi:cation:H+ antiporter
MRKSHLSEGARRSQSIACAFALLLVAEPLARSSPLSTLWTVPCILAASIVIAWGAEAAQFFIAQGFALAILAWMQTLPEFAVEAVLAWKQQTNLLLAGLTGALRLLTGLAWPMIYATAAFVHRRRTGKPLGHIRLSGHHSVEVAGILFALLYAMVIWWKASLQVADAVVLVALYVGYLILLSRLPPERNEGIEDLEAVPRYIASASRGRRNLAIAACFVTGGVLIYFTAEPFLGSLVAVALAIGIPSFQVIQWLAPVISEFPELLSTFYFARQEEKAPVALMNIASSNINQWTLLVAVLPVVFSISRHSMSAIVMTPQQRLELLLTIAQSVVGLIFLINMKFAWWEAAAMLLAFASQFVLPEVWGDQARIWIAAALFGWSAVAVGILLWRRKAPPALSSFAETWRTRLRR